MYRLFGKERHSRIRSPLNSPRHFEDNLPVLLRTVQMQWQRQAKTLMPVLSDGTNCFKYYHTQVEYGVKNVITVLNLNMADTRVEDIESDSNSSSFDNDDFNDDSDDNHYQKIARDIFGDSVKTMKFSRDFPSKCLKM